METSTFGAKRANPWSKKCTQSERQQSGRVLVQSYCGVKGHDFSRAVNAAKECWALAPEVRFFQPAPSASEALFHAL
jgi:hypothetical protein